MFALCFFTRPSRCAVCSSWLFFVGRLAHDLPAPLVETTTLPNGVRVSSIDNYGQGCQIGAFIDTGTAYEDENARGVCSHLARLAFNSTTANRTPAELLAELDDIGAAHFATTDRNQVWPSWDIHAVVAHTCSSVRRMAKPLILRCVVLLLLSWSRLAVVDVVAASAGKTPPYHGACLCVVDNLRHGGAAR